MSNQGKIIAADVEGPRSDRLIQNLERLGIGNTKIIRCDLRDEENRLKDEKLLFDKILLDVPCILLKALNNPSRKGICHPSKNR